MDRWNPVTRQNYWISNCAHYRSSEKSTGKINVGRRDADADLILFSYLNVLVQNTKKKMKKWRFSDFYD